MVEYNTQMQINNKSIKLCIDTWSMLRTPFRKVSTSNTVVLIAVYIIKCPSLSYGEFQGVSAARITKEKQLRIF